MPSRRRLLRPSWIILALLIYVGCRLLPPLGLGPMGMAAAAALLLAAGILVPQSIRRKDALAWVGLTALGFFSTLLVTTLLRDVLLLAARLSMSSASYEALLTPSALGAIVLTVAVTGVGFLVARRPRIVNIDIPIFRLPKPLHGFSITHADQRPARRPHHPARIRRAARQPRERLARRPHRGDG